MNYELFIDVNEEQQAIVSGGAEALNLSTFYKHFLQVTETIGPVAASSGPGGSTIIAGGIQKTFLETLETASSFLGLVS
ncbi:hypothetical protein H6G80_09035 [Nostoc sp. FACHB-87]|uniref:CTB family bacteriocin n=1 Tax=Nostocales TaxID=1161 RepID=UPI001685EA4E|nr:MULTISPECIES: CTB family bacteriocin [Nostocales]MBD2298261.1 hypothetical protein [Nostoc sp. FACHB-190]MBD2454222.1 hypothetical protein [Nostoc sp. FACHB-87]MBD2474187.1 hypothetical protein [Anabaena sp. FACHB-83]MBD2488787.1 hypothetical protein [Aulosira sp. FACHB-615]